MVIRRCGSALSLALVFALGNAGCGGGPGASVGPKNPHPLPK